LTLSAIVIWKWEQPQRLLNRRLTNYMKYTNVLAVSPCNPPRLVLQCLVHVNVCFRMSQSMIVHGIGANDLTGGTNCFVVGCGGSFHFFYLLFSLLYKLQQSCAHALQCSHSYTERPHRRHQMFCRLKYSVHVMRLGSCDETRLV